MKIKKLHNSFWNRNQTRLFTWCCCSCCCCCLLYPIWNYIAEAIVKKIYNHKGKTRVHFLWNLLYFTISHIFFILLLYSANSSHSLNDFTVWVFLVVSVLLYYFLMYMYSFEWLNNVDFKRKVRIVLAQVLISLFWIGVFWALSVFMVLAALDLF